MREPSRLPARHAALAAVVVALAASYALVIPIGEAPDEPAHLYFVEVVLRDGPMPREKPGGVELSYELHQPPLEYWSTAAFVRVLGVERLELAFSPNPQRWRPHSPRSYLPPPEGDRVGTLHLARLAALPWVLLTIFSLAAMPQALGVEGRAVTPWLFLLSPQYLFHAATFGNDHAVVALSSVALLLGVRLVAGDGESPRRAAWTGAAAGAALWAKASALFLAAPLGLVGWIALRRRWTPSTACLVGSAGALTAGIWTFQNARFGTLWPLAGGTPRSVSALLDPGWAGTLWASFWAKLGWFTVALPLPVYAWFLGPTALVVLGLASGANIRRGRAAWAILVVAIATNFLLLVVYQVRIDWQPQGRYLFPALAAFVGLGALGEARLRAAVADRPRLEASLVAVAVGGAVAVAFVGLWAASTLR